ncbi:MAG: hypothetical protein AAFY72_02830, partial [Cyanobacteria bacterium J06649_4]
AIQTTIPALSEDPSVQNNLGLFGPTTRGGITSYIQGQNATIAEVLNVDSASTSDNVAETATDQTITTEPPPNSKLVRNTLLAILALLATGGLGLLASQFLGKGKRRPRRGVSDNNRAANQALVGPPLSSQGSATGEVNQLQGKIEQLTLTINDLRRQNADLESRLKREQQISEGLRQQPNRATETPYARQTDKYNQKSYSPPTQPVQSTPPVAQSPAALYNQSPSAFDQKGKAALSRKSQEDLWVGKNVTPIFSPSPQGDYRIVTPDNKSFYIVLKDRALLNANSLKTLKIIYSFADQANLSSMKRRYETLAQVKPQGNEWALVQSGRMSFYS